MSKPQKPMQDERIALEAMKYRSEALTIIAVLLGVSIVIKEYILRLSFEASVVDVTLLILALTYPFVRGIFSGGAGAVQVTPKHRGRVVVGLIGTSAAVALVATFFNYQRYHDKYSGVFDPHLWAVFTVAFVSILLCSVIIYALMDVSARQAEKRINRQLDQE